MVLIWRAKLDAFWARESTTVRGNLGGIHKVLLQTQEDNLQLNLLPTLSLWEEPDYNNDMGAVLCLLEDSLSPGCHKATIKHLVVCKVQTVFSNIWATTPLCNELLLIWLTDYKKRSATTKLPKVLEWFTRCGLGLKRTGWDIVILNRMLQY